jgi:hypothetical protein
MPDPHKMRYTLELSFDDMQTLYCRLSDEVDGQPETRKLITSYRSGCVDDALYEARHELGTLLGDYFL